MMYVLDSTLFTSPEKSLSKQRAVEDARREILGLFYEEYFVLHKEIRFLMYLTKQVSICSMQLLPGCPQASQRRF